MSIHFYPENNANEKVHLVYLDLSSFICYSHILKSSSIWGCGSVSWISDVSIPFSLLQVSSVRIKLSRQSLVGPCRAKLQVYFNYYFNYLTFLLLPVGSPSPCVQAHQCLGLGGPTIMWESILKRNPGLEMSRTPCAAVYYTELLCETSFPMSLHTSVFQM